MDLSSEECIRTRRTDIVPWKDVKWRSLGRNDIESVRFDVDFVFVVQWTNWEVKWVRRLVAPIASKLDDAIVT